VEPDKAPQSRRKFLSRTALAALALSGCRTDGPYSPPPGLGEPIIDIHQHTHYHGRSDAELIHHQKVMGVSTTILLPAGLYYGLDAQCGRNESCYRIFQENQTAFRFFANEMPYLAEAKKVIVEYLEKGAIGIGEQKFRITADSIYMDKIAGVAKEFHVPILLHFQDTDYNMEFSRFYKTLEKFPDVAFIGHAQTWWGNISEGHDPRVLYPKGPVKPGGITDKLLSNYSNIFGDLSAGSGLNALTRDPDHTRAFFNRHQDKLLFGSDCEDIFGQGEKCTGAQIIAAVRQYAPNKQAERKMLYHNARRVLRLEDI
jgi:predicted TIM-barrel fold metal-dependent hydrolase